MLGDWRRADDSLGRPLAVARAVFEMWNLKASGVTLAVSLRVRVTQYLTAQSGSKDTTKQKQTAASQIVRVFQLHATIQPTSYHIRSTHGSAYISTDAFRSAAATADVRRSRSNKQPASG